MGTVTTETDGAALAQASASVVREGHTSLESAAANRFDVAAVRAQFPALTQQVHGKPLVYLDNAATTQKPQAVLDALKRAYTEQCANIHRSVHLLGSRATEAYEGVREIARSFLHAPSASEIVFTRGTTEAINLVAQSFVRPRLLPGDEILLTGLEHHSNIVPWQLVAEACGAKVVAAPLTPEGELDWPAFAPLLSQKRTKMVAVSHVSNALGTVVPVQAICRLAKERGVPVLIDGAQATPHGPVDVEALGCDFYAFSGHKVFGPTGIGVLWGRRVHLDAMPPYQGGGDMIETVTFAGSTFAATPHKFEAGTPNIAGAIGLGAALQFLATIDWPAARAHEASLLALASRELAAIDGITLLGPADGRVGVISFTMDGIHPHDVATVLDAHGVAVRAGHHCAQPVMQHFGVPATTRASFALYNTAADVSAFIAGVKACRSLLGPQAAVS